MKKSSNSLGFATRAIHHGYDPKTSEGALVPPVYMTSTFVFESAEAGGEIFAGERAGHYYSRISNPTVSLLEQQMAILEGGESGLATGSGMGAITSTLWTLLQPGDEIIVDKTLYASTFSFLNHGLGRFGVTITHVDLTSPESLETIISAKTKVVYFETPVNPNMRLVDIKAISEISHANGAVVIVDNTYATPYLTQPISLGADIVVHSATKYLGGHGDVVAGIVVGAEEHISQIRLLGLKDLTGSVMSPMTAMLIMRGLKTLELRMERHCKSAQTVAEYLEKSPAVSKVWFPGLPSFEQHSLAKSQMSGFGGMMAFELVGGIEAGRLMMNNLNMIQRAVSLGDVATLIQHPASMTHSTYSPEEREVHGISDGLVRLSVGLECIADILADIEQSLSLLEKGRTA